MSSSEGFQSTSRPANHGTIGNYAETQTVYGNVNAPIVTIENFTTVELARSMFRSSHTCAAFFRDVNTELAALVTVVDATDQSLNEGASSSIHKAQASTILGNCREVLIDLNSLKARYEGMGKGRVTWERLDMGKEELAEIRERMKAQISALGVLNSQAVLAEWTNVKPLVEAFASQIISGLRDGSVLSGNSTRSFLSRISQESASGSIRTADSYSEELQHMRLELEDVGITSALFRQHREQILETLRDLLLNDDNDDDDNSRGEDEVDQQPSRIEMQQPLSVNVDAPTQAAAPTARKKGEESRIITSLRKLIIGESGLIEAAKTGNEVLLMSELERGADLNKKGAKGRTALIEAVRNGNYQIVDRLLNHEGPRSETLDVNLCDNSGISPLWLAAAQNRNDIVTRLLAYPSTEPNCTAKRVSTRMGSLLGFACFNGLHQVVGALLDHPSIDPNNGIGRFLPLTIAASRGDVKCMRMLLNHRKIDPNRCDNRLGLPLAEACNTHDIECVHALLGHPRIDPNRLFQLQALKFSLYGLPIQEPRKSCVAAVLDHPGLSLSRWKRSASFIYLVINCDKAILLARLLKQCSHDELEAAYYSAARIPFDSSGSLYYATLKACSMFDHAISCGSLQCAGQLLKTPEEVERLLECLCRECATDKNEALLQHMLSVRADKISLSSDQGLLQLAICSKNKRAIDLLLKHPGLDLNALNKENCTPMTQAIRCDNAEALEKLLTIPEVKFAKGAPLHEAALQPSVNCLNLLLQQDYLNVNAVDQLGRTPLDIAVLEKQEANVRRLLEQPDIIIGEGLLCVAVRNGDQQVVHYCYSKDKLL